MLYYPRTGEIEHIIRVFFEQPEVFGHCIENKLVDGGGVVSSIQYPVRIAYGVEQPVFFDGVGFHVAQGLSGDPCCCCENCQCGQKVFSCSYQEN